MEPTIKSAGVDETATPKPVMRLHAFEWQVYMDMFANGGPELFTVHRQIREAGQSDRYLRLIHANGRLVIGDVSPAFARKLGMDFKDPATPDASTLTAESAAIAKTMKDANAVDAAYEASQPTLMDDLSDGSGKVFGGIGEFFGKAGAKAASAIGSVLGSAAMGFFIAALPIIGAALGALIVWKVLF